MAKKRAISPPPPLESSEVAEPHRLSRSPNSRAKTLTLKAKKRALSPPPPVESSEDAEPHRLSRNPNSRDKTVTVTAKKRALSPPLPVESSEDAEAETASSEEEEEEEEQQHPANPTPNPNADDGDEESGEDESGNEEKEDEESDEEEDSDNNNNKAPAAVPKPVTNSGSGTESGSDSHESESDADPPMAVKPISSKPMATAKSSEKATPFQRVWSLEDEITLLNGLLDYKLKMGIIPQPSKKNPGEFPALVKKSLNMNASVGQIVEKVRRLKNKYDKVAARSLLQFTIPHDRTAFEISEKIWGDDSAVMAANGKENAAGNNGYPFLKEAIAAKGAEFSALVAPEKLDPGKARALEEKFKKHKMAVMKHHIQKMELQKETFKLIMDGIDKTA